MISSLSPLKKNPNSQQCNGGPDTYQVHQSSGDDLLAMKIASGARCNSGNRFMSQKSAMAKKVANAPPEMFRISQQQPCSQK